VRTELPHPDPLHRDTGLCTELDRRNRDSGVSGHVHWSVAATSTYAAAGPICMVFGGGMMIRMRVRARDNDS